MKITTVYRQEQFTFDSTGETIEPVCGVWGLGTDLAVFSGYDTEHYVVAPGARPVIDMLTPAEAVELGEYMAAQWRAFADKHREKTTPRPLLWPGDAVTIGFPTGPATGYMTSLSVQPKNQGGKMHYTIIGDGFKLTASEQLLAAQLADGKADDKGLTPTEAMRAGMVSVADLAGVGERIAAALPSAEEVFSGKRIAGGVQSYHMAFDEACQRINELRNTGIGTLAVLHYKDGTKQMATWAHATSPQLVGKHAFINTGEFDEHGAVIWKESGSKPTAARYCCLSCGYCGPKDPRDDLDGCPECGATVDDEDAERASGP